MKASMDAMAKLGLAFGGLAAGVGLSLYLYTLPGLRRLPKERQVRQDGVLTISEAIAACRESGRTGWELVAFAQNLVARKFSYSRRNPWDSPARAFERGLGYCQQQALALKLIYDRLGIHSTPVYAMQCRFPPKIVHGIPEPECISAHTWLRVTLEGQTRDVCPGSESNCPGSVHFEVLSKVHPLKSWMRPFSHLGSALENARRDREALKRIGGNRQPPQFIMTNVTPLGDVCAYFSLHIFSIILLTITGSVINSITGKKSSSCLNKKQARALPASLNFLNNPSSGAEP